MNFWKALVVGAVMFMPFDAQAATVSYDFVAERGPSGQFGIATGTITFNNSVPHDGAFSNTYLEYQNAASISVTVTGGLQDGGSGSFTNGKVSVLNGDSSVPGTYYDAIGVFFETPGANVQMGFVGTFDYLNEASIPNPFWSPEITEASLSLGWTDLGLQGSSTSRIGYNFTSFERSAIAPVPLPAGMPLLLGGLAAFGLIRKKQAA